MSHAYAMVGIFEIKDKSGKVTNRLYRFRNPWGRDWGFYSGHWNDKDERWTTEIKA